MKTGDPKQVAVLGLIAVLAIAYLGFTFITKGRSNISQILVSEQEAKPKLDMRSLPMQVIRDSFFHGALLKEAAPPEGVPRARGTLEFEKSQRVSGLSPMPVAVLNADGTFDERTIQETKHASAPDENTGIDRKSSMRDNSPTVRLCGLMEIEQPVAFISIDGCVAKGYRAGDRIGHKLEIASVSSGLVEFRSGKKSFTLKVGQERRL